MELPPEEHGAQAHGAGQAGVHGDEKRIARDGAEGHAEHAAETGRQLRQRLHDRLHVARRLAVGVLARRDEAEDLGQGEDEVERQLDPHVDFVGLPAVRRGRAVEGPVEARRAVVDELLHPGRVRHRAAAEEEGRRDARDRSERDLAPGEEGVHGLDGRPEDDARHAGEGLDHVVRDAVQLHLSGLRDEVVEHLDDAEVEDHEREARARESAPRCGRAVVLCSAPYMTRHARRPRFISSTKWSVHGTVLP